MGSCGRGGQQAGRRRGRSGLAPARRRRIGAVVAGVVAAAVVAAGPVTTPGASAATPQARPPAAASRQPRYIPRAGPPVPRLGLPEAVERDDVGDPFVLPVPAGTDGRRKGWYVLFWTTDWRSNVPTAVSTDLVHWHRVADALPVLPSWALPSRTMTWAPAAVRTAAGWVLYYSTEDAANHLECIGRGFSTDPTGPYVDTSRLPLICQTTLGGSIDPSVVNGPSGTLDLVWKSDGNARHLPVGIWSQGLSTDGLSVVGEPHRLLGASQSWEHQIIEGPAMLADTRGGWWLFFSGGSWQSNTYDTGVAWCRALSGPCRPTSAGPLLSSTDGAVSPGGLDTFVDDHGRLWASYSAFPSRPADARAAMAEDRVLEIARIFAH